MLIMSVSEQGCTSNSWPEAQVRKGHDIGLILPPGKPCSLYQMDHYWDDITFWKKTIRYLDEQRLDW